MQRISTIDDVRRLRASLPGTVAFVPTMGFLHSGHLALMREGLRRCDHLVVSIFVNPTQFGPDEDLDAYPRDIKGDTRKCENIGCDLLFTPQSDAIYAPDDCTRVTVNELDRPLCGSDRPDHFEGVTTVVTRLFNIIAPDVAVFGHKDYQQLAIIRRLVRDLHFPVDVIGIPTVREDDGLAMSSRNRYLNDSERRRATAISRGLVAAHRAFTQNPKQPCQQILEAASQFLGADSGIEIDYVECVRPHTLVPYDKEQPIDKSGAIVAIAALFGTARLIDNLRLDHPIPKGPLRNLQ